MFWMLFSYVPRVLGSHGFMVFMISSVLFVSTLVALTSDVVLTNAKGGSHREEGKEKYRERERERTRMGDRQNRHRGDSNPCGQSPMAFESISLTARTQCLGEESQIWVLACNRPISKCDRYKHTLALLYSCVSSLPRCHADPLLIDVILLSLLHGVHGVICFVCFHVGGIDEWSCLDKRKMRFP